MPLSISDKFVDTQKTFQPEAKMIFYRAATNIGKIVSDLLSPP